MNKKETLITINNFVKSIDFSKLNGLVPAVAQDYYSKEILMLAFMNKEALKKTIETGYAHYFSRSRNQLWKKGETSGHIQKVKDIFYDCDNDSILLKVVQTGVACHTGHKTCFYSKFTPFSDINKISNEKGEHAPDINKTSHIKEQTSDNYKDLNLNKDFNKDLAVDEEKFYSLKQIFNLIKSRKSSDPSKSYVAKLLNQDLEKIGKKLQEESLEVIIAGFKGNKDDLIYEASDLIFFYMVLLVFFDIDLDDIINELKKREGISGIDEKNSRLT